MSNKNDCKGCSGCLGLCGYLKDKNKPSCPCGECIIKAMCKESCPDFDLWSDTNRKGYHDK